MLERMVEAARTHSSLKQTGLCWPSLLLLLLLQSQGCLIGADLSRMFDNTCPMGLLAEAGLLIMRLAKADAKAK